MLTNESTDLREAGSLMAGSHLAAGPADPDEARPGAGNRGRLDLIMDEIRRAKQDLVGARERLLEERARIDQQLAALERELAMLDQMDAGGEDAARASPRASGEPLSRRVLDLLSREAREMTFRELRERLALDRRESRNLGPVLNQLAKLGKVASEGRGLPWRLGSV